MKQQWSVNAGVGVYLPWAFDGVAGTSTWNWQYSPKEGGVFSTTVWAGALWKFKKSVYIVVEYNLQETVLANLYL